MVFPISKVYSRVSQIFVILNGAMFFLARNIGIDVKQLQSFRKDKKSIVQFVILVRNICQGLWVISSRGDESRAMD